MGKLSGHMMALRSKGKLAVPSLRIHASVDSHREMPMEMERFDREERKRLKDEVRAHKETLDNWDPELAANQAYQSLKAEHEHKKARLAELEARMKADKAARLPIGKKLKKKPEEDEEDEEETPDDEEAEDDEF